MGYYNEEFATQKLDAGKKWFKNTNSPGKNYCF